MKTYLCVSGRKENKIVVVSLVVRLFCEDISAKLFQRKVCCGYEIYKRKGRKRYWPLLCQEQSLGYSVSALSSDLVFDQPIEELFFLGGQNFESLLAEAFLRFEAAALTGSKATQNFHMTFIE